MQVILLFVQADANPGGNPAATASTLVGGRLGNGFDLQLLDLVAIAVALDPRQAGIDHVTDAGHRERGFGNVGGQHDATRIAGLKNPLLLLRGQPRKERQDFHMRRMVLAQRFGGIADFAFARQKHQHVAGADACQFVDRIDHGIHEIALIFFFLRLRGCACGWFGRHVDTAAIGIVDRSVTDLDRIQAPRDFNHRRRF